MVDIVVFDNHVYCRMELDTAYLMGEELVLCSDIVYLVMLDARKNTAEMSNDTVLSTIVNLVVSDDV